MGRLERFYPDFMYDSVHDIESDFFKKNNIRYVILDIDNTLVPYTVKTPTDKALSFLKRLDDEGIKYCFLSNNNEKRVELFNRDIGAMFRSRAKKPLLFGLKKVMTCMDAKEENTLLVGDQIFTDVWTGKRAGIKSMLVKPIEDKETLFFKFKRALEKIVLDEYRKGL